VNVLVVGGTAANCIWRRSCGIGTSLPNCPLDKCKHTSKKSTNSQASSAFLHNWPRPSQLKSHFWTFFCSHFWTFFCSVLSRPVPSCPVCPVCPVCSHIAEASYKVGKCNLSKNKKEILKKETQNKKKSV